MLPFLLSQLAVVKLFEERMARWQQFGSAPVRSSLKTPLPLLFYLPPMIPAVALGVILYFRRPIWSFLAFLLTLAVSLITVPWPLSG